MAKNLIESLVACGAVLKKSATARSRRSRFSAPTFYFERLEPRQLLAANPIISEFMASNDGVLLDEDGASSDWIEITNAGDTTVDLGGWSLTDDSQELTKWTFPTTTLEANQSLLVFASGKDRSVAGSELHSNFKLSADGEYLALVEGDGSTIAFDYGPEFPVQAEDISYGLAMDSASTVLVDSTTLVRTLVPTDGSLGNSWNNLSFDDSSWDGGPSITAGVGYEGAPTSAVNYSALINAPLTPLASGLSSAYARFEFQLNSVANIDQLSLAMQFDDGFIAYLNGVEVASQNAPASPAWNSLSTAGMPDDQATDPINFDLTDHLDDLNIGNNVLAFQLLNRTAGSSDMLLIPELTAVGASIITPFEFGYFSTPTPGTANGDTALGFTEAPTFSVQRGFYDTTFDVTLTSQTPGASLYYTTNGSQPSETNGTLYTAPVTISGTTTLRAVAVKDDFFPSTSITHTYLFAADIATQSASPAGYPSDWGTHNNGGTPFLAVADYEIDPDVVGPNDVFGGIYNTANNSRFEDALTSIPTISLTMDIDDAFDGETGFYANSISSGRAWERETSVEWWDPADNSQFQVNAGIRAHGGVSRQPWRTPKHGLRLYFRDDYGPGRLEFPLFGDESVTSFDRLVFRSHYNDSWQAVSSALHTRGQFIQDPFVRESFAATGNLSIRSRPTHVYINGLYWGVYDITERPDAEYFADHLGGDSDDYDVITARGNVQDGNRDAWDELINYVRTTDLSTAAGYEGVKQRLDVENLADYMLVNFFAGVDDWPHNNWVAANNRVDGGGFRFYVWDAEISMNQAGSNRTDVDDENSSAELYDRLRVNADFRQLFIDRALEYLSDGGVLSPEVNIERYTALGDQVKAALVAESARWGDVHPTVPLSVDAQWQNEFDFIINSYLPNRTNTFIGQLQNAGLASNLAAPEFAIAPGEVPAGTSLSLINNQTGATLYYSLDGTDPRQSGGSVSPSAQIYSGPLNIVSTTPISMRVQSNGDWSGIVSGSFDVSDVPATVIERGVAYGGAPASVGEDTLDPTKSAYQFAPGTAASSANYTNYTRGLNRVVFDLANSQGVNLTNIDFEFRVGNSNDPSNWTLVDGTGDIPLPAILSGTRDAFGIQRFTLAWPDLAIQNQWLQVTVKATPNTGLEADDVFYFGNQIADVSGATPAGEKVLVNSFDLLDIKLNLGSNPNSVGNPFDVNRSGIVDINDLVDTKFNQSITGGLLMLAAPAAADFVAVQAVVNAPVTPESSLIAHSNEPPVAIGPSSTVVTALQPLKPDTSEEQTTPEVEDKTQDVNIVRTLVRLVPTKARNLEIQTKPRLLAATNFANESAAKLIRQSNDVPAEVGTSSELPLLNFSSLTGISFVGRFESTTVPSGRYEFTGVIERDELLNHRQFTVASSLNLDQTPFFSISSTPWTDRSLLVENRTKENDDPYRQLDELFSENTFAARLRPFDFTNAILGA